MFCSLNQIVKIALVGTLVIACRATDSDDAAPPSEAPQNQGEYTIDTDQLKKLDEDVRKVTGAAPLWRVWLWDKYDQKKIGEDVEVGAIVEQLAQVRIANFEEYELKVALLDSNKDLLAANIPEFSRWSDNVNRIWNAHCSTRVDTKLNPIKTKDAVGAEVDTKKLGASICNYKDPAFQLAPPVETPVPVAPPPPPAAKPATRKFERMTVVYQCVFKTQIADGILSMRDAVQCKFAYNPEELDSQVTVSVPVQHQGLDNWSGLSLRTFKLQGDKYSANVNYDNAYSDLPFGSHSSCHTEYVDLKYRKGKVDTKTRLEFKRRDRSDGTYYMEYQMKDPSVTMDSILSSYASGAEEESVTLIRVCDWFLQVSNRP